MSVDAYGNAIEPGDWVAVYGQVAVAETHPEDVVVAVRAHNADSAVAVSRDRVVKVAAESLPKGIVYPCCHMNKTGVIYVRCSKHEHHGGDHEHSGGMTWTSEQSVGYIEDKS